MIGYLTGVVQSFADDCALVETSMGLGFEVYMVGQEIAQFKPGDQVALYTHLIVREDGASLFGFMVLRSRDVFRQLLKVNGVGPKVALAIIDQLGVDEVIQAILRKDDIALKRVKGLGAKTAAKVTISLHDIFDKIYHVVETSGFTSSRIQPHLELHDALRKLGYNDTSIQAVLAQGLSGTLAEQIKQSLQRLSQC